ncbi:argininosuccinate synthase domain-containing protein [Flavobacterium oreochromis]|uniref:argininosuccinate synthase n=1 Tax=Flavobacterium oreochromis TaxID=2906078 RepID=A0ABW8PA76_9FLAO|nr:argininosuccinate synthase domain-containing protein [Flavobacterium oreochromis]OWP74929.1 argininosuccinate synthase [Flavobacterium oreochromis]
MQKKKIVLAYSGGLDTTYCAVYLTKVKNYEVHAVTVNTGAFDKKEIESLREKALQCGASSYTCIDVRREYYDDCIKYLIYGNILKNAIYPLSVSAERAIQAKSIAEYAIQKGIDTIAHGSTGAGNDQVRFDMIFNHLLPNVEIITPIRDQKLSREAEIEFLKSYGIGFNFEKAAYSINKGLWGTSVGGKETLTSAQNLPKEAWPTPVSALESSDIILTFKEGELIAVNTISFEHPSIAIEYLQQIAQPFGIGRHIHVGDTIIGIKGRVGFEAAAPELIIKAHHLLEKHTLTKWQLFWKEQLANWYGNWLHEGQILDPTMRDIEVFFRNTQKNVTGDVYITLHHYRYELNGINSPFDLMSEKFGSYGEINNGWSGEDIKGFTKIFGNQTSIYHQVLKDNQKG